MPGETIQSLLRKSVAFFEEKGVDEAKRTAELLLAHALGAKRIDLYVRFEQPLREDELERFRTSVRRRLAGEPVQYILGQTEFYGLPFHVSPGVLIPRPETEHLVEAAVDFLRPVAARMLPEGRAPRVLDIGTGSGCIAIAVARHVPGARIVAVDVSAAALEVARANASLNAVDEAIEFIEGDVLADERAVFRGPYDLVLSNPPYIAAAEMSALQREVRDHEPHTALTDNGDGLTFYRRIALLLRAMCAGGGGCFLEIGYGQHDAVRDIFVAAGFLPPTFISDYASIPRVAVIHPA
jgi:release factor glutamine methyltransferase